MCRSILIATVMTLANVGCTVGSAGPSPGATTPAPPPAQPTPAQPRPAPVTPDAKPPAPPTPTAPQSLAQCFMANRCRAHQVSINAGTIYSIAVVLRDDGVQIAWEFEGTRKIPRVDGSYDWQVVKRALHPAPADVAVAVAGTTATTADLHKLLDIIAGAGIKSVSRIEASVAQAWITQRTGSGRGENMARIDLGKVARTGVGTLPVATARQYLARAFPSLRACYDRQLSSTPNLRGAGLVELVISGAGTPSQIKVSGMDNLKDCVTTAIKAIQFPRTGATVNVSAYITVGAPNR